MRIDCVGVAVCVEMLVIMRMVVAECGCRQAFEFKFGLHALVGAGAASTEFAIGHCARTFRMMMMAFLHRAHFCFKTQNSRTIFAHLAIHGDVAS